VSDRYFGAVAACRLPYRKKDPMSKDKSPVTTKTQSTTGSPAETEAKAKPSAKKRLGPVDLASESVAGEEDPGAAMDQTPGVVEDTADADPTGRRATTP
jgi:hypothetical protein